MIRLPRTIRLDPSDTFVFDRAAAPGEWAVSGAFVFAGVRDDALGPKQRAALRAGFLGVDSLGWSTLCIVAQASEEERAQATDRLADQLVAHFGAPSREIARAAAEEEIAFAQSLCDHPLGTALAVERRLEQGEIAERFRTLHAREKTPGADSLHAQARAFTFHEIADEGPDERVDLIGLMKRQS